MNNTKMLTDIINSIPIERDANGRKKKLTAEKIAAYLNKHNVIVLLCQLGGKVYIVNRVMGCVTEGKFNTDDLKQMGRRVFLNREDAENALKGGYGK